MAGEHGASAQRPNRREKTVLWRVLAAIVIPLLHLVGRYRFEHLDRIPTTGAFVFSANHYSNFDPLVTAYAMWRAGRVPRFLAKASLFRVPVLGAILRATGQIPVQRSGAPAASAPARGSSREAVERLIHDGLAVIVYPEGTLTREPDLWPMRGKTGAVRIALEGDLPLVPAASWGVQRIMPRYGRLSVFPRKQVDVLIGEPVDLTAWRGKPLTPEVLAGATEAVMVAITDLLAQLRDEVPPATRWNPAEHGQTEIGRLDA